jgi:hypothetical protein
MRNLLLSFVVITLLGWSPSLFGQDCPNPQSTPLSPADHTAMEHGTHQAFQMGMVFESALQATCTYHVQLLFNRKKYGDFEFIVLPLTPPATGRVSMGMLWPVKITGPRDAVVTTRLVSTSSLAVRSPQVHDEVHPYTVSCNQRTFGIVRSIEKYFKRCY